MNSGGGDHKSVTPRVVGGPLNSSATSTPFSLNLGNGRGALDLRFNSVPGWPSADPNLMTQYLQQMTSTLRNLGFTENTIEEIIRSIGCLATHGILTLNNPNDRINDDGQDQGITVSFLPIKVKNFYCINQWQLV